MKKQAFTALFIAALTVGMASVGTAASEDDQETTDVNVTVASTTALDVKPDQLDYTDTDVGAQNLTSDRGFGAVRVENTGSEEIDKIWLNGTHHTSDPFGTGAAANHDAANFLQVKPKDTSALNGLQGNDTTYHFVNRVEFLQSDNSLIQTGSSWDGTAYSDFDIGRFRAGQYEFYFVIARNQAKCDGSVGDPKMRVANTPSTPSSLGTFDFSDSGSDYTQYNITNSADTNYGVTGSGPSTPNGVVLNFTDAGADKYRVYDVLTDCDGSEVGSTEGHVLRTKYNIEAGGASDLESSDGHATLPIFSSTSSPLQPGQSFAIDTAVEVPRGVPTGEVGEGTMSVLATAAN